MNKFKKILATVCALAMLASMFSMFTVANAEAVSIVPVLTSGNKINKGEQITVDFKLNGVTDVNCLEFCLDLSDTGIVYGSEDKTTLGEKLEGGMQEKSFKNGVYKFGYIASEDKVVGNNETICTVTFTLEEDLTNGLLDLDVVKALVQTSTATYATADYGDDTATEMTAGSITVGKEKEYDVAITPVATVDGTKVTVDFKLKGVTDVNCLEFCIDLTGTGLTYGDEDKTTLGEKLEGGMQEKSFKNGVYKFGYIASEDKAVGDNETICTVTFTAESEITSEIALKVIKALVQTSTVTYATADYGDDTATEMGGGTATIGGSEPTPTDKPSNPTPTPMPAEDWTLVTTVEDKTGLAVGTKYEISTAVAEGKEFTGNFDIVVAVYNAEGVAVGFVVYNDVEIGEVNTFYTAAGNTISVNTISDIDEDSSALFNKADMLAAKK